MRKLRIMWLHSHISHQGGGTKYILGVIKELSKNHKVDLYLQKGLSDIVKQFTDASINVTVMDKNSTGDLKFWLIFNRQINKEIELLRNLANNYDLVISSMFPMNIVANALGLPHIQCCFQPFAFFWDPLMIDKLPLTKRLFLRLARNKFGKLDVDATTKSAKLLTINNGSKNAILEIYHKDSVPTFMGVDLDQHKPDYAEIRKKYLGKKIILHSTDWTPLKKTPWLLQQFGRIQEKYPDVVLLITEPKVDPKLKNDALKKIQGDFIKNIEFLGTVPPDLLSHYYSLADIVVYPGSGSGITTSLFVLECMAHETPAVVSIGASEDIEHGKTGFIFKTDDEFQNFVLELLTNDDMRLNLGRQARDHVLQNHSWNNVAKIFENQCFEVIKNE